MNEPVRIGVLGVGRMGAFHARSLANVPGVTLAAIADTNTAAVRRLAVDLPATVTATSPDALFEKRLLDGVLIATPTPTHPELVKRALDAGLHVLCEKPLSLDPAAGGVLGAYATAKDLVLQVGFWRRFSPPWVHARRLIDAGAIGRPLMVRLAQWDADPPPAEFCDPAISGGLAIDCGVHEYDLAEWLTGLSIVAVTGHHLPIVEPSLAEVGDVDNLIATLELSDGAIATVDLSRNSRFGDDVRTEILGSDGAILVDTLPTGRTRLAISSGIEVVAGSEVPDATLAGVQGQAMAFAAAINRGPIAIPDAWSSDRAVAIGNLVDASARDGVRRSAV